MAQTACEISDIAWTLGPNVPEFRKGGCLTAMDGKVISVFGMRQPWGEMATMYIYDPATDWWLRGPDGPIGQVYVEGTECGNAFYAIGGRNAGLGGTHTRCFRLEQKNGSYVWDSMPNLNEARGWAPSVSVGSKLFVIGGASVKTGKGERGQGSGPTSLSSVEMWDSAEPGAQWKKITEIPGKSRGWTGDAAVQEKIYLVGGSYHQGLGPGERLREVWQFDPKTTQWKPKSPLPYLASGFDTCVYKDRYLIVVGGYASSDEFAPEMKQLWQQDRFHKSYYCPFVLVYDTVTDLWHRMPSLLPMPTNDIRVVLLNNKIYALGGENIEPATSNTTPWLRIGEIRLRQK